MSIAIGAVSYTLDGAAEASGIGRTTLERARDAGDLICHYVGRKPVIRAVDLDEWVQSLPTEKESA